MKYRNVCRLLWDHGYEMHRHGKGTHVIFIHPSLGRLMVSVHHGGKELPTGTLATIRNAVRRAQATHQSPERHHAELA